MSDPKKGLYQKYCVTRTDGSSEPGGKHFGDGYFVLNLTRMDLYTRAALSAYAASCWADFTFLADDLEAILEEHSNV